MQDHQATVSGPDGQAVAAESTKGVAQQSARLTKVVSRVPSLADMTYAVEAQGRLRCPRKIFFLAALRHVRAAEQPKRSDLGWPALSKPPVRRVDAERGKALTRPAAAATGRAVSPLVRQQVGSPREENPDTPRSHQPRHKPPAGPALRPDQREASG